MTKVKASLSAVLGVLFFAVFIFLGAGKLLYWQGLLYLATALLGSALSFVISWNDDSLIEERTKRVNDGKD